MDTTFLEPALNWFWSQRQNPQRNLLKHNQYLEISTEKICDMDSDVNQTSGELFKTCPFARVVWFKVLQRRRQTEQQSSQHVLMIKINMRHFSDFMQDVIRNIHANSHRFFCSIKMFFLPPSLTLRQGQGGKWKPIQVSLQSP